MDATTNTKDWIIYQNVSEGFRSLRAMRKIRQGETVYDLSGLSSLPEADMYSIEVAKGVHLDCEYVAAGAINHSCNPNAAVLNFRVVAWRCIEPGEEVTIDYRRTETHLAAPFTCNCCGNRMEW